MAAPPTLSELIETVQSSAPTNDALDQLATATSIASELNAVSESLLGHFVGKARKSRNSWTKISGVVGVSKAAAFTRFGAVSGGPLSTRLHTLISPSVDPAHADMFTVSTYFLPHVAMTCAEKLRHPYLGTEHYLLGLFTLPHSTAFQVLDGHGLTRERVEQAITTRLSPRSRLRRGQPPMTPEAEKVLEDAHRVAANLGHMYVGTEHVLLALCRASDDLSSQSDNHAAVIMSEYGLDEDTARAAIMDLLNEGS